MRNLFREEVMQPINIPIQSIGELASGEPWWAWTTPDEARDHVAILMAGIEIEEEATIWAKDSTTGLTLQGELEQFFDSDQGCYTFPAGTRVCLEVLESIQSQENGPFFWDEPESGETYSHKLRGTITIHFLHD